MLARAIRLLSLAWCLALLALVHAAAASGLSVPVALGLGLLLFGHPTLLALEFALARRADVRANGRRAGVGVVLRAWAREWVHSTLVFGWRLPWRANAVPDHLPASARGQRGVVFVHGMICNRAIWNPWLARMRALSVPFAAVNLEPAFGDIEAYVPTLDEAVRRVEAASGRPPLIVAHSMGGIVARAWLRAGDASGASARVAGVVTIGTPHGGTWLASAARSPNARQMRRDSPWLMALARSEPADLGALFTCWWSECDQIVFPPPTAVLPGSDARQLPGSAHVALCLREEIWADLRQRLGR